METRSKSTDIFCKVIDNLGDIGVCWRLARQLATEHGLDVRLWVDDPAPLVAMASDNAVDVRVCEWSAPFMFDAVADVVIEAFGCALPENYARAMAARTVAPVWVNLEYLGLEDWVEGCHGMASPHPKLSLVKHFFFPGFTARTGGLLRERDLLVRQAGFRGRDELLAESGWRLAAPTTAHESNDPLLVSLFCYDPAPFAPLLAAWVEDDAPLVCLVPPGKPLAVVRACLKGNAPWTMGNVRIIPIPFLSQEAYDELLYACDLNFVRGEDSFVRAQWAGKPFVWQIYPQDKDAHVQKLEAFLDRYRPDPCLARFWRVWNAVNADFKQDWSLLRQALPEVARHNALWREKLLAQEDLASALVNFCSAQV
ncbi:MAG: elongation factor P maturation arginine rhamnosyltransferase EarP [Zoogloeaceae bacterium]|jgi:uncharacterized repeat protein (TIGR03837 family)|nr:elongation factor P maturation arginine rhamnosyltransferase EarP [Zoogloeaceae bacterium]